MTQLEERVVHYHKNMHHTKDVLQVMDPPERDVQQEFSGSASSRRKNNETTCDRIRRIGLYHNSLFAHKDDNDDHSGDIGYVPAVERSLKHAGAVENAPEKPCFLEGLWKFLKAEGHEVAPDTAYSDYHKHSDTIPEAAVGVAPDWAYRR